MNQPEKVKVGIVCFPGMGGSGIVATILGQALCKRRYEVHFIAHDVPHRLLPLENTCKFHQVRIPHYPVFQFPPYTVSLSSEIVRLVEKHLLDIIHVHYAVPHSTSALMAKMILTSRGEPDIPIITTLHGTDSVMVGCQPYMKSTVEWSINGCDAVTAVSNFLKEQTGKTLDIRVPIRVIHNPINTDVFAPRETWGREEGEDPRPYLESMGVPVRPSERIVMHVSNLRPVKRLEDTLLAFEMINHSIPSRLVILGEGPDLEKGERLAREMGLEDRIHFLGKIVWIEKAIREADVLLSTSETESFGMSIAEAMSSKVLVAAYRVGGIPEVIVDGENGHLVDFGDFQTLAFRVVESLVCPKRLREMGENGREHIHRNFSVPRIVPQYEELYETLRNRK